MLANRLMPLRKDACVVLALRCGGVPVAAEVAEALNAPLDLIVVREISAPHSPELALAAIVDGAAPVVYRDEAASESLQLSSFFFGAALRRAFAETSRHHGLYGRRPPIDLNNKTAIVIDDGAATRGILHAALCAIRKRNPARLVLGVPVAAPSVLDGLREESDEIVWFMSPEPFDAAAHYREFEQVSDNDVRAILRRHNAAWAA